MGTVKDNVTADIWTKRAIDRALPGNDIYFEGTIHRTGDNIIFNARGNAED